MAIDQENKAKTTASGGPQRTAVGFNVVLSILLVIGIVGFLQYMAFSVDQRADMTSSGVNSLSDATESFIDGLDQSVHLTSLYFESDIEEEDQAKYRRTVSDLLSLYQVANRSRVTVSEINPLQDHDEYNELLEKLQNKGRYKEQVEEYKAHVDRFLDDIQPQVSTLLQGELAVMKNLTGTMGLDQPQDAISRLQQFITDISDQLGKTNETIRELMNAQVKDYSAAVNSIRPFYQALKKNLDKGSQFAQQLSAQGANLPDSQRDFLKGVPSRFADATETVESELTKLEGLEPLELDQLLRDLNPTGNAILVETDDDAEVLDFESVWPVLKQAGPRSRPTFKDRGFRGPEQLTSAILRATHKQRTAVVFVHYGGQPMFNQMPIPGQPQPIYARIKQQLEEANFQVEEWDTKLDKEPPTIDPEPTRTIYVVHDPTAPPPADPRNRGAQEPPFGPGEREAVLKAVRESGRAMFISGFAFKAGPFGATMTADDNYFGDYLSKEWGLDLLKDRLVAQFEEFEPGKFAARQDPMVLRDVEVADHPITSSDDSSRVSLPLVSPIKLADKMPDKESVATLITVPRKTALWAFDNFERFVGLYRILQSGTPLENKDIYDIATADYHVAAKKEDETKESGRPVDGGSDTVSGGGKADAGSQGDAPTRLDVTFVSAYCEAGTGVLIPGAGYKVKWQPPGERAGEEVEIKPGQSKLLTGGRGAEFQAIRVRHVSDLSADAQETAAASDKPQFQRTEVIVEEEQPFTVAVAATKPAEQPAAEGDDNAEKSKQASGDNKAKLVLVSANRFAEDGSALSMGLVQGPQGSLSLRIANPGNYLLLLNSLHWLNDNTEFMNLGQPVEAPTLAFHDAKVKGRVTIAATVLWPAVMLAMGMVAWFIRRK